uniref:Complement factor H-related protein 1-like n=1 Tax=Crassostrea virginica TaxID=6565 RepID=A0A8B8E7A1_CRAVI|nr:complement factor H-related protein 1-like [Crassostrea virginica]
MTMKIYFYFILLIICLVSEISEGKESNCEVPTLRNGRVRLRSKGRVVRFRCRKRFELYGPKIALCLREGWTFPPPFCVAPGSTCPKLKPSKELTISKELNSGVWKLSCQPGLQLQGRDFIYCDGSKWSGELPSCLCKCRISNPYISSSL